MRKSIRNISTLVRVCVALAVLVGVILCVRPALAEAPSVSGLDYLLADQDDGNSVDILSVAGQEGDTIYVNIEKAGEGGNTVLASHLAYTLNDQTGDKDNDKGIVGAVSVSFNEVFNYNDTYAISVYNNRDDDLNNKDPLFKGTISTVYAKFGDNKPQALAVRTLKEDENRPFNAPESQKINNVTYELTSNEPQDVEGKTTYLYKASGELEESVDAHITYYDSQNPGADPFKTETITLAKDTSQTVDIQPIVSADKSDDLYRTLLLVDSLTVSYPGTTEYRIPCKKLGSDFNWGTTGSFFKATIKYVDTEGNGLGFEDNVIVNKKYTYTAPDKIYVNDEGDTVKQYQIKSKDKAVLQLQPGDAEGSKEYDIVYEPVSDDAPRTWTVVLENGSVAPKDAKRVIKRVDYTGLPGETAKHPTEQKITVDGVDYVPAASAQDSYEHTFSPASMEVEQTIYYVPDGYVAPEAYDVTVNYVNIANNEVIDSQTYTATPSMRGDLEITSPDSFAYDGIEWVKLAGQEAPIRHGFYSGAREYTIYYRDINDDLHATTIIRNVRVVYVDENGATITRPTTIVDNGTTQTDNGETQTVGGTEQGTTTTTGEDATVQTGLQTGENLRSVDGEDGQQLVGEDGTDLATTRIEDEETPMAQSASQDAAGKANTQAVIIGGVAAAVVAAAGLIFFFVFKRRKKGAEETSNDDLTAE